MRQNYGRGDILFYEVINIKLGSLLGGLQKKSLRKNMKENLLHRQYILR